MPYISPTSSGIPAARFHLHSNPVALVRTSAASLSALSPFLLFGFISFLYLSENLIDKLEQIIPVGIY